MLQSFIMHEHKKIIPKQNVSTFCAETNYTGKLIMAKFCYGHVFLLTLYLYTGGGWKLNGLGIHRILQMVEGWAFK